MISFASFFIFFLSSVYFYSYLGLLLLLFFCFACETENTLRRIYVLVNPGAIFCTFREKSEKLHNEFALYLKVLFSSELTFCLVCYCRYLSNWTEKGYVVVGCSKKKIWAFVRECVAKIYVYVCVQLVVYTF